MTNEFIALPFKPAIYDGGHDFTRGNESWTTQTRVYQRELSCNPAKIKAVDDYTFKFSTDRCTHVSYPFSGLNANRSQIMYHGFGNDYNTSGYLFLTEVECRDPNLFLAIWVKPRIPFNKSHEVDLNALCCKPSYYYQTHEVTVDGTDGSILKADPVGKRTNFTQQEKIIDIITFEGIVGQAATASGINSRYFSSQAPDSTSRLKGWGLRFATPQISYVIGLSPGKTFDDFRDPITFRNGLDRMHKLLFNNALETLLVGDSGGKGVVGRRVVTSKGIVVVPFIAHILAGFLGLVAVCLGGVFLVSYNRQNNLASDPDTLGTKMALVAHSETLLRDFEGTDECSAPNLCMKPRKYKLRTWGSGGGGGYRLDIVDGKDNPLAQNPHALCTLTHGGKLVGPVELGIWMGLVATLVNIALLTLLIVLYKSALRWNGRTRSNSSKITRNC